MLAIALPILAACVAAFLFIRQQNSVKGRWGTGNFRAVCPRCGTAMPIIRKPTSRQEALWGGWTCPKCGCKMDKYGRERAADAPLA